MISVLKRHGYDVKYDLDDDETWDGDESKITVDNIALWDFIESMNQSQDEVLRDCVLLVTRHFDERVKSFIKNLVLGTGADAIKVDYYEYRVEFQVTNVIQVAETNLFLM